MAEVFVFVPHARRQVRAERAKKMLLAFDGFDPVGGVHFQQRAKRVVGQREAACDRAPRASARSRSAFRRRAPPPSARSRIHFRTRRLSPKPGHRNLPSSVGSEPVHAEDPRRTRQRAADVEPVLPVVAHVVAAEGQHRHRVAPQHADLARRRGGRLRRQRGAEKRAVLPARAPRRRAAHAAGAARRRGSRRSARPRDSSNSGDSVAHSVAGVVKRLLGCAAFSVDAGVHGLPLPVERLGRRRIVVPFPPRRAVAAAARRWCRSCCAGPCRWPSGSSGGSCRARRRRSRPRGSPPTGGRRGPARSQAMSSPTVQAFQPGIDAGGTSIARFVLPQARGKRAGDVVLASVRRLRARGSACARPASPRSRASQLAMRSARHFLPRSALPP